MIEFIGIFFALVAAFSWGSSLVPLKLAGKVDGIQYSAFLTLGIFLSTIFAIPILNFKISFDSYGIISGIMWALANVLSIISIRLGGLSRVVPIVGGGIIFASFLWGVLFFGEKLTSPSLALLGLLLLIFGIPLVIANREKKNSVPAKTFFYSTIAGVIFGSYITPLRLSGLETSEYIFSMVSAILITNWLVYFLSLHLKSQNLSFNKVANGLSSGLLWNIGNITSLLAINSLGLSIGLPLTQLQLLIAVCWGIFYFKEIMDRKSILKIILGAILLILGGMLLVFSK